MKTTKILIADDHAMMRAGLASLLGSQKEFKLVGEACDGEETVRKALELRPDVIIMDLLMPRLNGDEATQAILKDHPEIKVIILTSAASADGISRALNAGATGALLKSDDFSSLAQAVRDVADGKRVIAPDIERAIKYDPPVPKLTERQEEILASIMRGLTNADISLALGIHEQSVKRHVGEICEKIGAANRVEAAVIALRKHLLKL